MYLLVDPSCYENMNDFRFHIFTTSLGVFPKIFVGDVIRMYDVKPNSLDFRIYSERDIVVFPLNEQPICSRIGFTFTEDDIAQVQKLKTWSLERFKQHAVISNPEPKIITLNVSLLL